jgi:hypothetical protein
VVRLQCVLNSDEETEEEYRQHLLHRFSLILFQNFSSTRIRWKPISCATWVA